MSAAVDLVHQISRGVPAGAGQRGGIQLDGEELDRVLVEGARALVERHGIGTAEDLERTESEGRLPGADPAMVSERAKERGSAQLGTMGSGNHFVEAQRVERVIDPSVAEAFGLREGQVTVLIHSGSRGFGHQVCTDYVKRMDTAIARHGIVLPDRQLACAPLSSPEGQAYLAAMACAANFAWANRQAIAHRVREAARAPSVPPSPRAPARSTTSPTTWPSWRPMRGGRCASTARGRPAPSRQGRRRSPLPTGTPASRSSSRAAWGPAASSCGGCPERWSAPSDQPATERGGG